MLIAAERPVILVGQGVQYGGAAADLLRARRAAADSGRVRRRAASARSTPVIRCRSGWSPATASIRPTTPRAQADVLLALGVRFDDRTSSSWLPGYSFTIPPTKLIHVDIDPDEIARNYPVALGLMADVRTFLRQLLAELDARDGVATRRRRAQVARQDRGLAPRMGRLHRARLQRRRDPDQPAARRARDRQGAAGGRDPRQRYRRPPQLAASSSASRAGRIR